MATKKADSSAKNAIPAAPKRYVIYHNPRCNKSRETLDRLRKRGVEPKIIEYLKTPIQATELDKLLKQMELLPNEIVRTEEVRFLDLELDRKPPKSRASWIMLLADNPVLIERPIVTDGI